MLACTLHAQEHSPILRPGERVTATIEDTDPIVETETLLTNYTYAPVVGKTFAFQVPASGAWHLDLRSSSFDS